MAKWSDCAICGRAIPLGELCYGIKNWKGDPEGGETICKDCLVPENSPTLAPPNEPLTLEELRKMNGEPVWVKRLKGLSVCDTGWAVIEYAAGVIKGEFWRILWPGSEVCDTPLTSNYGKTWLAYRRPPEGEENT